MTTQKVTKHAANNSNSLFASSSRNELIPIITNKQNEPLVEGSLLHSKLEVKTPLHKWIRRRVQEFGFQKNSDFFTVDKFVRGQKKTEYHLTMDMAKELSMVERTSTGRKFRQYFIEAEKELRAKRLYASVATVTEINKVSKPMSINGRKLYELRKVRAALGYSTQSSTANVRRSFDGLLVIFNNKAWVAEEYVKVLMARAKTRALTAEAKEAQAVLPLDFGQLPLRLKGGRHA